MFKWFNKLFKGKRMYHRIIKAKVFKKEDFLHEIATHMYYENIEGEEFLGPAMKSQKRYDEAWMYFCAILQRALINGKRIRLPGIGTFQLTPVKGRTIKPSGLMKTETFQTEDSFRLKAWIDPVLLKHKDEVHL